MLAPRQPEREAAPLPDVSGIDASLQELLLEAYAKWPNDARGEADCRWDRRMMLSQGAIGRVPLLTSLHITPPHWFRIPTDLPAPFGIVGVRQWCTDIPARSPLIWFSALRSVDLDEEVRVAPWRPVVVLA